MPFRWNETSERLMLIKFVEQNMNTKFDASIAIENWPTHLEAPTNRSIGDRFRMIKQQITKGKADFTSAGSDGQSAPATPNLKRSKYSCNGNGSAAKRQRTTINGASSRISSSFSASKVKVSGTSTIKSRAGVKGKRRDQRNTSDDDSSMSEDESNADSTAEEDKAQGDDDTAAAPVHTKRVLPTRGLKSAEPGLYTIDQNEGSNDSGTEAGSDVDTVGRGGRHTRCINGSASYDVSNDAVKTEDVEDNNSVADNVEDAGSDCSFDISAHRLSQKEGAGNKKVKTVWRDRVNAVDGIELEVDGDSQD